MIRTLTLVAAVSFVLAVGCIAAAFAGMGGPFWIDETGQVHHSDWRDFGRHHFDDEASPPANHGPAQRTLSWPGGQKLLVDAPADISFTQGSPARLVVSGPADLVERLRLSDGRLWSEDRDWGRGWDRDGERLKIVLTAPDVRRFTLDGDQTLTIDAYDHEDLRLDLAGSGTVTAHGRAKQARLQISGSGEADLGALSLDRAEIDLSGSGQATAAPKTAARIAIAGSGDVKLLTHPAEEEVDIAGSGHLSQPDAK